MTSITITLSLPPRQLSPNYTVGSRGARMGKANMTKAYRQLACLRTKAAMGVCMRPQWKTASAVVVWYAKDLRRRDKDNCLASLKSAFDGIADAGLLADDSGLTHLPLTIQKDKANPRVEITITRN